MGDYQICKNRGQISSCRRRDFTYGPFIVTGTQILWTQGFKTRFRLISLDKFDNTEPIIVFTSTANQFDNLEGMTFWKDKKGEMRCNGI